MQKSPQSTSHSPAGSGRVVIIFIAVLLGSMLLAVGLAFVINLVTGGDIFNSATNHRQSGKTAGELVEGNFYYNPGYDVVIQLRDDNSLHTVTDESRSNRTSSVLSPYFIEDNHDSVNAALTKLTSEGKTTILVFRNELEDSGRFSWIGLDNDTMLFQTEKAQESIWSIFSPRPVEALPDGGKNGISQEHLDKLIEHSHKTTIRSYSQTTGEFTKLLDIPGHLDKAALDKSKLYFASIYDYAGGSKQFEPQKRTVHADGSVSESSSFDTNYYYSIDLVADPIVVTKLGRSNIAGGMHVTDDTLWIFEDKELLSTPLNQQTFDLKPVATDMHPSYGYIFYGQCAFDFRIPENAHHNAYADSRPELKTVDLHIYNLANKGKEQTVIPHVLGYRIEEKTLHLLDLAKNEHTFNLETCS